MSNPTIRRPFWTTTQTPRSSLRPTRVARSRLPPMDRDCGLPSCWPSSALASCALAFLCTGRHSAPDLRLPWPSSSALTISSALVLRPRRHSLRPGLPSAPALLHARSPLASALPPHRPPDARWLSCRLTGRPNSRHLRDPLRSTPGHDGQCVCDRFDASTKGEDPAYVDAWPTELRAMSPGTGVTMLGSRGACVRDET